MDALTFTVIVSQTPQQLLTCYQDFNGQRGLWPIHASCVKLHIRHYASFLESVHDHHAWPHGICIYCEQV